MSAYWHIRHAQVKRENMAINDPRCSLLAHLIIGDEFREIDDALVADLAQRIQDAIERFMNELPGTELFERRRGAHCPKCGYTYRDCLNHMDHHLCGEPTPPRSAEADRGQGERAEDEWSKTA